MVSHDRAFLNNVASSTLVFEGRGRVCEYVGGYDDWLRQRPRDEGNPKPAPKKAKPRTAPARPRKLTFKEQRELERMPDAIEELEVEKRTLFETLADPALYKSAGDEVAGYKARLEALERDLKQAYARWEQLEDLALESGA
jgi:ATP-binding cassette subfamily F protein uup